MWESNASRFARSYGLIPASEIIASIPGAVWKDMAKLFPNPVERHHYGEDQESCHLEPYYNISTLPRDWRSRIRKHVKRRQDLEEMQRLIKLFKAYEIPRPKPPKELTIENSPNNWNSPCLISYIQKLQTKLDKTLTKVRAANGKGKAIRAANGKGKAVIELLIPISTPRSY